MSGVRKVYKQLSKLASKTKKKSQLKVVIPKIQITKKHNQLTGDYTPPRRVRWEGWMK